MRKAHARTHACYDCPACEGAILVDELDACAPVGSSQLLAAMSPASDDGKVMIVTAQGDPCPGVDKNRLPLSQSGLVVNAVMRDGGTFWLAVPDSNRICGLRLEHHLADASRTSSATLRPDHAAAFQACIPSPLERHRAAGSEAPLFRHEGMLGSRSLIMLRKCVRVSSVARGHKLANCRRRNEIFSNVFVTSRRVSQKF